MLNELSEMMNYARGDDVVTVSITRDGSTTTGVSAVPFNVDSLADDKFAGLIDINYRFYRILAADYVIDAVAVAPDVGDIITEGDNEYEVNPAGPGETPYDWHDLSQTTYRVFASFTKINI